ncbi:hypothetical protein [Jeotgalibacillus sp. R-1-5s-1]|uniref:hypothetical protein n=1 Tax=Jeotgalibacillus sp. R-1-5s-1 TaxID=2555897 RepID=UPI00106A9DB9|nr:hypothetical protein [Jeotgalibacillus sp. R-1-5s-1]TFD97045.1 hypothetical protein E2491_10140 [Jeotgalibacillus sp. R-1-5s-1]
MIQNIRPHVSEGNPFKVYEITLPNQKKLSVISIEEIIIHRLDGIALTLVYPENDEDYEWAYRMFLIHKDYLGLDYLTSKAKEVKVFSLIENWFYNQLQSRHSFFLIQQSVTA